jgi:hypothetical protein
VISYAPDSVSEDEDPGWPRRGTLLLLMLPLAHRWYLRRHRRDDPLVLLRALFLGFGVALVWFGIVFAFTGGGLPNGPVLPWVPILAVIAAASVLQVQIAARKPLDCASPGALAGSYRTRFFLTIASTETVAAGSCLPLSVVRCGSTTRAQRSRSSGSGPLPHLPARRFAGTRTRSTPKGVGCR